MAIPLNLWRHRNRLEEALWLVERLQHDINAETSASLASLLRTYNTEKPFELGPYWRYLGLVLQCECVTPDYMAALGRLRRCILNACPDEAQRDNAAPQAVRRVAAAV